MKRIAFEWLVGIGAFALLAIFFFRVLPGADDGQSVPIPAIETSTMTEMPCPLCHGSGGWYFGNEDKQEWRSCPIWECHAGKVPVEVLHFMPRESEVYANAHCGPWRNASATISRAAVP